MMPVGESKSDQNGNKIYNGITSPRKVKTSYTDPRARLRRTHSVAHVEEISAVDRKTRRSQHDKPCHEPCDSLFSWSSGFNRFEGFINWGALLLLIGGFRLFLENVLKYGIRINPTRWTAWFWHEYQNDSYFHTPLYLLIAQIHYIFAYTVEIMLSQNLLESSLGLKLHIGHLAILLINPVVLMYFWSHQFSLLGRTVICVFNVVSFLKIWSYVQVNYWCRQERDKSRKYLRRRSYSFKKFPEVSMEDDDLLIDPSKPSYSPVEYPNNLNIKDFTYFLAAPTLCYELNFPRSHAVRIKFLLRRVFEVFILSNILLGLFQQWIIPSVMNSFKPFSEMNYMKCSERLLKLAIPNHLLWLIWFYLSFHSFLNTLGELLKFGDRNFYQDWWNAKDVGTFWKLWNLPVHKWCVRHVYSPVIRSRHSRFTASLIVFALSAFFHEYLVSVPLGMYKVGVFLGMLMQVPLVYLSALVSKHLSERLGNVMVWASLILGQPIGIMIYYHDYMIENYEPHIRTFASTYEAYMNETLYQQFINQGVA